MGATQPRSTLRSVRSLVQFVRKSAVAGLVMLGATVLFSAAAKAQVSVAIATDQSSLNVPNQFGVPANRAVDASGDYAFIGDGLTALFYRHAGSSTVRLLQVGDAVPGFTGSQLVSLGAGIGMNSSGRVLFTVTFNLSDGIAHRAILTYDGANYNTIAYSDTQAPGTTNGTIYGGLNIVTGGINDNGDVAFIATLVPPGPATQVAMTTLYIAPGGGTPVRVVGFGDAVPGLSGSAVEGVSGLSLNSGGQVLVSSTVFISGVPRPGLLLASISGGVQKIVLANDAAPTGGTFLSVLSTGNLNNNGQVVFYAQTSTIGVWQWTSSSGAALILNNGASAPASLGTGATLTVATIPGALDDADDLLLTTVITGGATPGVALLRYHLSGGAPDIVAYTNETAPGVSGQTFSASFGASSMANDSTVSFQATFNSGGHAIYTQGGTGTPMLVATDGGAAPVSGGGGFALGNSSPRSLGGGLTFFNAGISGGTGYYGEFLGTSSSIQPSLMSTADALPAGARVALPAFSAGTNGGPFAFLAQQAGGRLGLFEVNLGSGSGSTAPNLLIAEGATAPGVTGPISFAFTLSPTGTAIFVNNNGQVLLPATLAFSPGQALLLASPAGVTKVVATGDPSPVSGTTFTSIGWNTAGPSPLNDSGQVAFGAILSGGQGVFLYGPGGIVKIAATGDSVPGISGTIASFNSSVNSNPNLGINSSGQVAFGAAVAGTRGFFVGSGGSLVKVAANGDITNAAGVPVALSSVFLLSSFNDQQQIAFQASITGSPARAGIFIGTPGGPLQAVAVDGATAPGTGGGTLSTGHIVTLGTLPVFFSSADVQINDEGDIAFRSAVTGSTANSGYFRILSGGPTAGALQAITLQGHPAPGGAGTFGTIAGAFSPGTTFTLGQDGEVAFAGTVINGAAQTLAGDFLVGTDGTISKILLAGDVTPWSTGGTVSLQAPWLSDAGGGSFVLAAGASGGSANQAILITLPASGGSSTSTSLVSSQNPSTAGQPVLFTATVTGAGLEPTGPVGLVENGTLLAADELNANGQVTFMLSSLGVGSHSLTAVYVGDELNARSTSPALTQMVTSGLSLAPTSVSLGSSPNPSNSGQSVLFTATVSSTVGGTPTGNVGFLDSGVLIGTGALASGQATFSTTSLVVGSHSITAEYFGDTNFGSSITASALDQTVEPPTSSNTIITVAGGGSNGNQPGICAQNRIFGIFGQDYYASSCATIFRVTPGGVATLIAGTGPIGFSGDGNLAINAQIGGLTNGFLDASGNIYIADANNNRIRVINRQLTNITVQGVLIAPGNIQTVAGNGTAGYNNDNISALSAELNAPTSVAVNSAGDIFIADELNQRIRKVSGGIITTVGGTGTSGFNGDGAAATLALLNNPSSLALDSTGNVYIADQGNNRIRVINTQPSSTIMFQGQSIPAGDIQTIAGTTTSGYNGDSISATTARLSTPVGVFVDASGNVFIADQGNERIREVSNGVITTVAGDGVAGYNSGPSASTGFIVNPFNVYVNGLGNIFFSDYSGVEEVVVSTGTLTTVIGNDAFGFSGDTQPATSAQLFLPQGVAVDPTTGAIVIADAGNYRIRKIGKGGNINTIAGNGAPISAGDNSLAINAAVEPATGVAVDKSGNIFFGEKQFLGAVTNCRVREIVASTGIIKTVAGTGVCGSTGDGAAATSATISQPNGIAVDAAGNLYIAQGNGKPAIRVVNMQSSANLVINGTTILPGNIQTVAGTGVIGFGGDGTAATATGVTLSNPQGISLDSSGNIFIADTGNLRIRVVNTQNTSIMIAGINIAPGAIMTVAGSGIGGFGIGDGGPATSASLSAPSVVVDGSDNIFIGDGGVHVREVVNATGIIQTVAGSGVIGNRGFAGDGGPATSAWLNGPIGVTLDGSGNLYFSDEFNARVRFVGTVNPVPVITSLSPTGQTAGAGPFTLTVNGSDFVSNSTVFFNGNFKATTFVNAMQLTATINASDVAASGTLPVMVNTPTLGGGMSASLPFTVTSAAPPFGSLDSAVDASGSLQANGWAVDPQLGAPVAQVQVLIDGVALGNATLGGARPDVAAAFGHSNYTNSGWTFTGNIGNLSAGAHTVSAVALDSSGASAIIGAATITVTVAPPFGSLDSAVNASNGQTTLAQGGSLQASGWAVDPQAGAPVSKVQVLIDGVALGNATLGGARPDVATAFGHSNYTNSGWTFTGNIGNLSVGAHTVSAVAFDSSGASATIGAATITVAGPPFGSLDSAVNASNGQTTLAQGGSLQASGWAVDPQAGAPVAQVQVLIDGVALGNATLGGARPDVAAAFGHSNYTNSGWTFTGNIGNLSAGAHTVSAVAFDSSGASAIIGAATITVTVAPPFGSLDSAVNASNGQTTLAQGGSLQASGWAVDPQAGAPVSKVQVLIDGVALGNATLGGARPDVATAFGHSNYTNSGWTFTGNIGNLSVGAHTVSAVAFDSSGASATIGAATITVAGPPFGSLDSAVNASNGQTTLAQGGSLQASGWAVDPQAGAPVAQVQVLIDGVALGNATLGGARPDVAAAFGHSNYTNSGWTFTGNIGNLSAGAHTVSAVAFDSSGASAIIGAATITVTVAPPFGSLDSAVNASNGQTTLAQGGSLQASGWAVDPQAGAPVSKVQVLIDGVALGNATLGGARPDVATAFGHSNYTNSGWTFTGNIGNLSVGAHTVSAVAFDSSGASATIGAATITVAGPPFGSLDSAVNASNGQTTLAQGGSLQASGWAVDPQAGAPVAQVQVLIDGVALGNATLGGARPDVAAAFGHSNYTNSGWTFTGNIGNLSAGAHTVSAVAFDSSGASAIIGAATITVTVAPPFGSLDSAVNASNGQTTLAQGGSLQASGWAVDPQAGAPVSKVQVLIDGVALGNATLGGARPDVATAFGHSNYTNSGWTFTGNIGNLSVGAHTVSAVAFDSSGASATIGAATITVAGPPFGSLDSAVNASNGQTTLAQGGSLQASGWAVDPQAGAPVAQVQVLIDGVALGNATLGGARPDVAAAFGHSNYTNSGWTFTGNIGNLSAGAHTVSAVALDSSGASAIIGAATITVTVAPGS